ncbi:MAG: 16S rRNA (cytosine(1402)-N(4))-methyltransferase RsmH, partial [Desulfuromonadales bacterium]|nr:16S rRNA (cytosine(1402)-N(4))-methyltransferase RsmH [Desulfuromonadales bacterium]
AAKILTPYGARVSLHHACFADLASILDSLDIVDVDGILFDLGVSSWQLDSAGRGFSFRQDGPLDMRMDPTQGESAADVVNQRDEAELMRIFREYGEERFAGRIARHIVQRRSESPFTRTTELAELVRDVVPGGHIPARIHPATRIFQALRIEVNGELEQVKAGINIAFRRLKVGGRLAIISFHSLEDRIVKQAFQQLSTGCNCPPKLPLCACGRTPVAELLTRRGIKGSITDSDNPRARSAVLRAIRKLCN